jgi:hypothetical protein
MAKPSSSPTDMRSACPSVGQARLHRGCGVGRRTSVCFLAGALQLAFLCSTWAHPAKDSAARSRCAFLTVHGATVACGMGVETCEKSLSAAINRVGGRWLLRAVLDLCWTTMVGALDLGPDVANWKSAVETASPGTAISFRPGVYHGCNVAIPAGLAACYSFLTNHVHINLQP